MGGRVTITPAPDADAALARAFDDIDSGAVTEVIVGGSDVNGVFRAKRIPASRFRANPTEEMHFSDLIFALDVADGIVAPPPGYDGWFPDWAAGFGDICAVPDVTTYRRVPWLDRTGLVLVDYTFLDGQPLAQSPRSVLQRVAAAAAARQYVPLMSPELEFTVLRGRPDDLATGGFRDLSPLGATSAAYGAQRATVDEHVLRPIREALAGLGIEAEAAGAEAGFGQYELNVAPLPILVAADTAFLFKHTVREVADLNGHTATFMARPLADGFGSSMHVHQSVWSEDGTNLFWDAAAQDRLSALARQFIAGQLATMREFSVLFAPTVNSYKRLLPETAAGTTCSWAIQSKTVGIRVCNESENSTRVEHRMPGADANPYLVFAAALAGGLWGIEKGLDPGPQTEGNAYADEALEQVPGSLSDAIDLFEQSEAANHYFGEETVRFLAALRRSEAEIYRQTVTDWEIARYLTRV